MFMEFSGCLGTARNGAVVGVPVRAVPLLSALGQQLLVDADKIQGFTAIGLGVGLSLFLEQEGVQLTLAIAHEPGLVGQQLETAICSMGVNGADILALFLQSGQRLQRGFRRGVDRKRVCRERAWNWAWA